MVNLIKQVRGPPPAMSSAYQFYTPFRELRKAPPFPVADATVLQWISMFNSTSTFGGYFALLER